eukprot:753564-Hanusia_phi.AAC.1
MESRVTSCRLRDRVQFLAPAPPPPLLTRHTGRRRPPGQSWPSPRSTSQWHDTRSKRSGQQLSTEEEERGREGVGRRRQQEAEENESRSLGRSPRLDVKVVQGHVPSVDRAKHLRHDAASNSGPGEENFEAVEEEDGKAQPGDVEVKDAMNLGQGLDKVARQVGIVVCAVALVSVAAEKDAISLRVDLHDYHQCTHLSPPLSP